MTEVVGWAANALAVAGWIVNIKFRPQAMLIFTLATILSLYYFCVTRQLPFALRFAAYLVIDAATLYQCRKDILRWIGAATP